MAFRSLQSFFPTAEAVLGAELARLGEALLVHLNTCDGHIKQGGKLNLRYLVGMLENQNQGLGPRPPGYDYGAKQAEITKRVIEAWHWLGREGYLLPHPSSQGWHVISTEGEELLSKLTRYERWEQLGVDGVKADLVNGGRRVTGGPPKVRQQALEWVRMKEAHSMLPATTSISRSGGSKFIADTRLDELRNLPSSNFDFRKLIRLCEELNSSYAAGNYYATAMLTRAILDHLPPVFGYTAFAHVANNYGGGGKSFREAMQNLEGATRRISDGHLHTQIRSRETLPTPQQIHCGPQIDTLLAEVIRITT